MHLINGFLWGWGFVSDHKADAAEDAGTQKDSAEGAGECPSSLLPVPSWLRGPPEVPCYLMMLPFPQLSAGLWEVRGWPVGHWPCQLERASEKWLCDLKRVPSFSEPLCGLRGP